MEPDPTLSNSEEGRALGALSAIDYDWTMHLRSVWSDPAFDAPQIHAEWRREFGSRLDRLETEKGSNSPLGWLMVGQPGSGKTHWLSICRKQAAERGCGFVLVDMTDVREFWSTVLQGYLDSLQQEWQPGKLQQQVLLEKFLGRFRINVSVSDAIKYLASYPAERLAQAISRLVDVIRKQHPRQGTQHQDVVRALLAVSSQDASIHAAGLSWLNANPVDGPMRTLLGFSQTPEEPHRIVRALSWIMGLCGPTVLAFDQLDPIVAQLDPSARAQSLETNPESMRALSIIQQIANGLGALRDATCRTLTLVSCLDSTLHAMARYSISSWLDRFEAPRAFASQIGSGGATGLIAPRVAAGCEAIPFSPPYPTWPITESALNEGVGLSPRDWLKLCEAHRRRCLAAGRVIELATLKSETSERGSPAPAIDLQWWDARFAELQREAPVAELRKESNEEEPIESLLLAGCRCLLRQFDLPARWQTIVDDFSGGKTTKPLHARIRLIDHEAGDREEHFCFRSLERSHAIAFQARLKGAINGSGIDRRLPFRHCLILRSQAFPAGAITQELLSQYENLGGLWSPVTEDEIRVLCALKELELENKPGLEDWLKRRLPTAALSFFQAATRRLSQLTGSKDPQSPPGIPSTESTLLAPLVTGEPPEQSPPPAFHHPPTPEAPKAFPKLADATSPSLPSPPMPESIPLGQRLMGTRTETVSLPVALLEKHTIVLAGAGSGKTVLLKRIVEEAALAGIPSIVIDGANDLAALGDIRPDIPAGWGPEDPAKAQRYHQTTQVVTWTPGRESGNNLVFEPLPDFASAATDPDSLQLAIDAAVDAIGSLVLSGRGSAVENRRGILSSALKYFAEKGSGNLEDFIELLSGLPPEAGLGIAKEGKLAKEMADTLKAKIETNPMLRGIGAGMDPGVLFGDTEPLADLKSERTPGSGPSKVRISVINLMGLATPDLRQQFIYQLGMTLFGWIKRHPNPPGRPLRGLLVVDEAKDFVPSGKSIPSKVSIQLLASQARKYHLGLVLATQMPKEVENRVVGNCATHFYGRASSPAAIQSIQELLQNRGGQAEDVATLKAGHFFAYNAEAGMSQPVRLLSPMCLSHHQTLEETTILANAAKSKLSLAGETR